MNLQIINGCAGADSGLPTAGTDPGRRYCVSVAPLNILTSNSLDPVDVAVGILPVKQQVRLLVVVHANVFVVEHAGEKIVYLHCHVQNITNTVKENKY